MTKKPRQRTCKIRADGCHGKYRPFNSLQKCCENILCAIEAGKQAEAKKQQRKIKEDRWRLRENDLQHQLQITQKSFNAMIRALDKHKPCVSCGKPAGTYTLTAGHFLTVGSHPELRFDPRNCHGQCGGCNSGVQRHRRGDSASTRAKFENEIARRYGQPLVDFVRGPHKPPHYTCSQLKQLRSVYQAETKRLERGESPSLDWRSLDLDKSMGIAA